MISGAHKDQYEVQFRYFNTGVTENENMACSAQFKKIVRIKKSFF